MLSSYSYIRHCKYRYIPSRQTPLLLYLLIKTEGALFTSSVRTRGETSVDAKLTSN